MFVGRRHYYPTENVEFLNAKDMIKTTQNFGKAKPLLDEIAKSCEKLKDKSTYITQGFIGSSMQGETTTLGRGGSDYSAALFAEAIDAKTLQIWTDVAGIATTDPRLCPDAVVIKELSFLEASELATFGAKVLHPTTLQPAVRKGICVFVGSTFDKDAPGTWIKPQEQLCTDLPLIRAMALKKDQTLLTLTTPKMLDTHGFLAQIFTIFDQYSISVDAITTSEISVAMTIENSAAHNKEFIDALTSLGSVKLEEKLALVSLIGNNINHTAGLGLQIFAGLQTEDEKALNVRMICLGASRHNFCMVMDEDDAIIAIERLHRKFINS
jgi:aspartate kinase